MRSGVVGILLILAMLLAIAGCSGGNSGAASAAQGRAEFILDWPREQRAIPAAVQSIRIEITLGAIVLRSVVRNKPLDGGTIVEVLDQLPVGIVNYAISAYAYPMAVGALLGTASGEIYIQRDRGTQVAFNLSITDVVTVVKVTAVTTEVRVGESITLSATARNAADEVVMANLDWSSNNAGIATVDGHGRVTGVSAGAARITARERVTGKSDAVTVTVTALPPPPPPPPGRGKIVFYSDRTGYDTPQIFVVNADGSGFTQLTFATVANTDPVFNRTGTRILYVSGNEGSRSIYLMQADGSGQQRLNLTGNDCYDPAFSPDGATIAYCAEVAGNTDIYLYHLASGNTTRLTTDSSGDFHPSFSPDGSQIVFASTRSGNAEIYLMHADGSNVRRLTNDPAWDGHPVFHPGGNIIGFATNRANGVAYQTYLMDLEGNGQRRVLDVSHCSRMPTFSPDGSQIAFAANPGTQFDIYLINPDGAGFTLLLGGPSREMHPSWAP